MIQRDPALESLLASLRDCHEPCSSDRRRVRRALAEALVENRESDVESVASEISGVHARPESQQLELEHGQAGRGQAAPEFDDRLFEPGEFAAARWQQRRPQLLVGAVVLAAAAAVAVVAFARPGGFLVPAVVAQQDEAPRLLAESAAPERARRARAAQRNSAKGPALKPELESEAGVQCGEWPCWKMAPARTWSLGGAEVGALAPALEETMAPEPAPPALQDRAPREETSPPTRKRSHHVEVLPALAFAVGRDGVTPGVGARLGVPLVKDGALEWEATALEFGGAAERRSRLALGTGLCWNHGLGKVDVALCGQLGYERARSDAKLDGGWRLTGGVGAHAVYNLSRSTGAYLAVQTAAPLAGTSPSDAHFVRVMAGPEFRF